MEDYCGFKKETNDFCGRSLTVVHPKNQEKNAHWAFKTECFDAFPYVQIELLNVGYYLVNSIPLLLCSK